MATGKISVKTSKPMQLLDITSEIQHIVADTGIRDGILYLFNPHTTAGLTINEGADPDVRTDIIKGLKHIVPQQFNYLHAEGNSPSHIMTLLTGSSLSVFIDGGRMLLGTWQKIFFCEYDGPRNRSLHWKIIEG